MELTISTRTLHDALRSMSSLASSDYMLPVLNAVHLRTEGGNLIATATDRFVAGILRTPGEFPDGFEALVPLRSVAAILRTFRPKRGEDPELTLAVEDGWLSVSTAGGFMDFDDARVRFVLESGEFPKNLGGIIRGALAEPPAESAASAFNMKFLAKFAAFAETGAPLSVRMAAGSNPMVITDSERFVGCIMPRRRLGSDSFDLSDFSTVVAPVADLFAEPAPVKAPRKRAARKQVAS